MADKWNGFTWRRGVGLEFFITEGTSIGAEALYHSFEGNGNAKPYRLVSALGLVNLYFGPGPSQRRTEEALKQQQAETEKARRRKLAQRLKPRPTPTRMPHKRKISVPGRKGCRGRPGAGGPHRKKVRAQAAQAEVDQVKQMVASKQISPVTFKSGSSDLLATSNATLDKVAAIAKKYPNLLSRVEGHTDSTGSSED